MSPPRVALTPTISKTCDIPANYKPISTIFSGISLLTSSKKLSQKNPNFFYPLGWPHPHIFQNM